MKFGVVQFPGSNCDDDAYHAIGTVIGQPVEFIWHQSEEVSGFDAIILPGGFAFGDYLRTGAIARFSPVMKAVSGSRGRAAWCWESATDSRSCSKRDCSRRHAAQQRLRFLCRQVHVRVENTDTPFTCAARPGQILKMPIAHMEGNYFCDAATLAELERNKQIVFRYVHADGREPGRTISTRIRTGRWPRLPACESRAKCGRADAASGARRGIAARLGGWPGDFPVHGGEPFARRAPSAFLRERAQNEKNLGFTAETQRTQRKSKAPAEGGCCETIAE